MICPKCQHEFQTVGQTNLICYRCGHRWRTMEAEAVEVDSRAETKARRRWRIGFWLFLLFGPMLGMFAGRVSRESRLWLPSWWPDLGVFGHPGDDMLGGVVVTAVAAGYCLWRSRPPEAVRARRFGVSILLAIGFWLTYVAIVLASFFIAVKFGIP